MKFIDQVLQDRYQELGLEKYGIGGAWATVVLTPQFVTSRHVVGLVFAHGSRHPSLVVKVPRQPGDNEGVRREGRMLRHLALLGRGRVKGIPEVVAVFDVGDHTVLVETALTGNPLDPARVEADVPGAMRAGAAFVDALPSTRAASENEGWYERTIGIPLRALVGLLPKDVEVAMLVLRTHKLLEPLRSVPLPAIFEHGDLSHPNLLLPPDGSLRVFDWERATLEGLPGHDLVFYLQYLSESAEQAFSRVSQVAAFDKAFRARGWALPQLRDHLRMRGVDPDLLPLLVVATWARSAATLAHRLEGPDVPEGGPVGMRAAVAADRDFWLWRHVVNNPLQ